MVGAASNGSGGPHFRTDSPAGRAHLLTRTAPQAAVAIAHDDPAPPLDAPIVGTCNYTTIVRGPFLACHLGYQIAASHEGQGLMAEALRATNAFVFRYSAITWNAHRIHYDAAWARGEEGYPAIVTNGGLSMHLMVDAALRHAPGELAGYTARLVHPIWVGDLIEVRGLPAKDGRMTLWAADKNGVLCGEMEVEFRT